eukprot:6177214-Pleurochrysis_carterae.AAC.2
MSAVARNENMGKLQAGYLFPEIGRRRNAFLEKNPDAKIISLGIGDTTRPIPPHILKGLTEGSSKLGTDSGYAGYGPEQGVAELRSKIAEKLYDNKISPDEVFVSDGSKCDIGRLQLMFGSQVTSAVQVHRRWLAREEDRMRVEQLLLFLCREWTRSLALLARGSETLGGCSLCRGHFGRTHESAVHASRDVRKSAPAHANA